MRVRTTPVLVKRQQQPSYTPGWKEGIDGWRWKDYPSTERVRTFSSSPSPGTLMMTSSVDNQAEEAVRELLAAQHDYEVLRAAVESPLSKATSRREQAIRAAAACGLSRRKIADMTGMSHTRVIEILDGQPARRAESMQELRTLSGWHLADKLTALALSNSLSRDEMARATGLTVEDVNRLIKEHAEQLARDRHTDALVRVRLHMPGWSGTGYENS